jgi:pimeloyl-ACP methyl ester carboxylesterase
MSPMNWHASEVRVQASDGTEIVVHDLGGEGPPLLLAHATGFHGLVWDAFADAIGRSFRTWSFDARGHGASGKSADMSWVTMGDDVLRIVDALGIEQPFGFGHSLGGALLVIAEATRPNTFRQLYLYEPAIIPPNSIRNLEMIKTTRRRRASFPSRKDAYENYAAKAPLNELSEGALWAYVDHGFVDAPDGTVTLACTPDDEAATFTGASERHAWEAMSEVHVPVTIGHGDRPDAQSPGQVADQAEHLRAERQTFAGLGHFGPLHDAEAVATAVTKTFSA